MFSQVVSKFTQVAQKLGQFAVLLVRNAAF